MVTAGQKIDYDPSYLDSIPDPGLLIQRYNQIPSISSPLVPMPLASAHDPGIVKYAPPGEVGDEAHFPTGAYWDFPSILYSLQENLLDEFTPPVTPIGISTELLAEWEDILNVAAKAWRIAVANAITGLILVARGVGRAIYGNGGVQDAQLWWWPYGHAWRWQTQADNGAYLNVPLRTSGAQIFHDFLVTGPELAGVRGWLLTLGLQRPDRSSKFGDIVVHPGASYPVGWHLPYEAEFMNGADDSDLLSTWQPPIFFGMPSYQTCLGILRYCSGSGSRAMSDSAAAMGKLNSAEQAIYNYQAAYAGLIDPGTAPYASASKNMQAVMQQDQAAQQAAAAKAAQQAAAAKAAQQAAAAKAAQQAAAAKAAQQAAAAQQGDAATAAAAPTAAKMSIIGMIAAAIGILLLL